VYFYISGGGFSSVSNTNPNGSYLVQASGHQVVIVSFNYRVGLFGFLASAEVRDDPSSSVNNGLYDQRKALEWVNKYIKHFGGDPNHVTIGGESAGAASVFYQLTAYNGRDDGLFHAAAAESQSFATQLTIDESQYQYDYIVNATNCSTATNTLSCLRAVSADDIQRVNKNIPFPNSPGAPAYMYQPVIDGTFVPDLTYRLFANGHFLDVPVIFGDDTNGGTVFVPPNTTTRTDQDNYLRNQFPYITQPQLDHLDATYPNPNATCPNTGCLWRKASDIYGDLRYMCGGLYISSAYANYSSSPSKNWNYLYNVTDPAQNASGLGVPHTVERPAIWGYGYEPSYAPGESNAFIVPLIMSYWLSFIRSYDPNTYRLEGSPEWGAWTGGLEDSERLVFETAETTGMRKVGGRWPEACEYAWGIGIDLRQ
jgi:cholinesterase